MECARIRKMISPYMDDELRQDEKKAFGFHIQSCAACKNALEKALALHQLFASAERFPAPYGFAERVLANLEEQQGFPLPGLSRMKPFFLRAAQVAFALGVMTIGIVAGNLLLPERTNHISQTAIQESFSLDLFQAMPPGSIGGAYVTILGAGDER
jgi:anti-sigma factor RsiW